MYAAFTEVLRNLRTNFFQTFLSVLGSPGGHALHD